MTSAQVVEKSPETVFLRTTLTRMIIIYVLMKYELFIDCFPQVRVSVIQMLPSAEIDDLPVVVRFILQSVSDNDAFEVRNLGAGNNSFVNYF